MRIIKVTRGTIEAERRLVAAMINMEHGARVVDDDGKALAAPHESYPTIKVAPRTEKGLPTAYHYKPSVGVVFYSASSCPGSADRFNLPALLLRLKTALAAHGDAHLRGYRSVSAGPCVTIRQKNKTAAGTDIVGPRHPFKKRPEDAGVFSSRMLLYTPTDYVEVPPHISYRAAFTWVFMNGAAAVNLETGNMAQFNAAVASIFYDAASVLALEEGSEVHSIKPEELKIPVLATAFPDLKDLVQSRRGYEALLIERTGEITAVGCGAALLCDRRALPPPPEVKWGSICALGAGLGEPVCLLCAAPLWGQVFILFDPKEPSNPQDIEGLVYNLELRAKSRILGNRGIAICRYCIGSVPHCITAHLQCQLYTTTHERTQESALKNTHLEYLLPIVTAGRATPVQGMPGVFAVGKPGEKPAFVLTTSEMAPFIELGYPNLLALNAPIVRYPQIVEAC